MKKPKHGWNSLNDYISVHERVLRTKIFAERMVTPKSYSFENPTDQWRILRATEIIMETYKGTRVRIDITKHVEIDPSVKGRHRARTFGYTYSANIPKGGPLIRYCGPHDKDTKSPDHHKFHHKHDFTQGEEIVIRIADDEWPHVDEFLREVLEKF